MAFSFFLLGASSVSFAQSSNNSSGSSTTFTNSNTSNSDSLRTVKKKQGFLNFLKNIVGIHKKKSPNPSIAKNKPSEKKDTTLTKKKHHKAFLDFTKGGFVSTTLYTQGVNDNTGINGFYNLNHAFQNFQVMGAPFTAEATVVSNNWQYKPQYSTYSIHFDAEEFSNMLQNRAKEYKLNQVVKKKFKAPFDMSDSIKSFDNLGKQLNSPKYQSEEKICEKRLQESQDSLEKDPCIDTTELHTLREQMGTYMKMEKRYSKLFQLQEKYKPISASTSLNKDFQQYSTLSDQEVKKELTQNKQLKPYEKLLMGVQKFNIGECNEELSDFTFHNFMMKGGEFAFKTEGSSLAGGYGKQQAIVDPYLMTGITVPTYNRTVEFMRFGLGADKNSNLYATVLHISDPGSATSLTQNNWVADITKKVVCSKAFDVQGELAQSYFNYNANNVDISNSNLPTENKKNFAYSFQAHGIIPFIHTSVKATYENIQGNFITLGNPYLLTGASIYRLDISQAIGAKLILDAGGDHTVQSLINETANKQTDNWLDCALKYRPTHWLNMEFKYAPRQFQEQEGTVVVNSITSNINQVSFLANAVNKIAGDVSYATVFLGNFQYSTPGSSTFLIQNTNLSYYMFSEVFAVSDSKNFSLTGNESRNNWTGSLYQFIGQETYNTNIKKNLKITSGVQWVEQPEIVADADDVGIIGGLTKSFSKWGMLGLQINCRNNVNNLMDPQTVQLILTSNISIFW